MIDEAADDADAPLLETRWHRAGPVVHLAPERGMRDGPLRYRMPAEAAELARDLARLRPAVLEISALRQPPALSRMLAGLGLETRITVTEPWALSLLTGAVPETEMAAAARALLDGAVEVRVLTRYAEAVVAGRLGSRCRVVARDAPPVLPDTATRPVPGHVLVLGNTESPAGSAMLASLARAAAAGRAPLRLFAADPLLDPDPLERTGRVHPLPQTTGISRPVLARALGCRTALVIAPEPDPTGRDLDRAAALCPRIAVIGAGGAAERARDHPRARSLGRSPCPTDAVAQLVEIAS